MPKRIAFFADGTWDSPGNETNVYQLFKATPVTAGQVPFYADGVGVDGKPLEKLLGGALGEGLFQKIKDGYTKIAHVYESGDEIFLFGFSRGSFTARSLAGMIAACGLPRQGFDQQLVETAFRAYRNQAQRAALLATLSHYQLDDNPQIKMVGVWDTVGALGIPAAFGKIDTNVYGFLDTSLNAKVQHAYHALSIDERRREFPPTLWTLPNPPVPNQTVEQVWFPGVHCDVGGGYAERSLADLTLAWMMSKAAALGLEFSPAAVAPYGLPCDPKWALGEAHESWDLIWGFPKTRELPPQPTLANSVAIRSVSAGYRPENLSFPGGTLDPAYPEEILVGPPPLP